MRACNETPVNFRRAVAGLLSGASLLVWADCAPAAEAEGSAVPPGVVLKRVLAKPTAQQYAWQEQERIQFICLDPCTWQGREYDNHSTPLSQMRLEKLDTDQWCRAAVSWGAKEILFVAKHTGGFCWWQTETTEYSVKSIPWKNGKGDLLGEVAEACRRHGLKLGVYVYSGDELWGAIMGSGGRTKDPSKQEAYNKIYRQQMTEVLSRYGKVEEIWFDGGCIIPLEDIILKYQPEAMKFGGALETIRWPGTESGMVPYPSWSTVDAAAHKAGKGDAARGSPDGDRWLPAECDTPLYDHNWFWAAANEQKRKSLPQLINIYYKSAGHGGVLLLNSTPNTDGLIPEGDLRRYREFGEEIQRRFGQPIAETAGRGTELLLGLEGPRRVNHVILMEDYREGHRIREYVLEGWREGQWQPMGSGSAVGRMRIQPLAPVVVEKVRLRITRQEAEPLIRRMAMFDVPGADLEITSSLTTGKPAKASSEHSAPYAAEMLVDGDENTRWGAKDDARTPWIEVDLGSSVLFGRTVIRELADRVRKFRIEYRDTEAAPWKPAVEGTRIGPRLEASFPKAQGRFVRLNILEATFGPTLWEFQLYPPAAQWATCGTWKTQEKSLRLELSPHIPLPGEYEIRLEAETGSPAPKIKSGRLYLNGSEVNPDHVGLLDNGGCVVRQTQMVTSETKISLEMDWVESPVGTGRALIRPRE